MTTDIVTIGECQTLRLLHSWGWNHSQIRAETYRRYETIARHINRECEHRNETNIAARSVSGPLARGKTNPDENVVIGEVWTADRGFVEAEVDSQEVDRSFAEVSADD